MATRRGHGEGTAPIKRSDGRWAAALTRPDGKRKWFYGKSRKEVHQKLQAGQVAKTEGRLSASSSQKTGEYLDGWLTTVSPTVKASTYAAYELNVRRLKPHIGSIKLDALRPAHVQDAYNLLRATLKPLTVRQIHLTLHKALKDAMRLELVNRNATEGAMLPRIANSERPWYTAEQLDALFKNTEGDRFHALWVILGTCGVRLGEALGLMWSDIDLDGRKLTVRRTLKRQRHGGGFVFEEPKSKRSKRTIDLPVTTCDALQTHKDRQTFEREKAADMWQDQGLVFPSEVGTPLEIGRVHKHWTKATSKAGIPRYRPHDLRHTVATHLTMAGMGPREVADVLGHSNASLVLEVYGHVAPSSHRRAADLMDALLERREAP